jgi:beta-1,4-mannosyl-glycoprotein beta-1,4-N-acetylglucosaminyltransferase
MTYDCFPFFNELDILEIRLNTLDKHVDKFVLVEASKTQSLLDKPYFFEENKARYSKFLNKIIHVKVSDNPDLPGWVMENYQRNCITRGLVDCNGEDTILISDVDEIPNLNDIDMSKLKNTIVSFDMSYHTFYANLLTENKRWIGTASLDYSVLATRSPQTLRNRKDFIKKIGIETDEEHGISNP